MWDDRRDRPTITEIDLACIARNIQAIRKIVGPGREILGVVKADAYGHGAIPVARTALNNGATWLGVALVEEGIALRRSGSSLQSWFLPSYSPVRHRQLCVTTYRVQWPPMSLLRLCPMLL